MASVLDDLMEITVEFVFGLLTRMGSVLTPGFILLMSAMYQLKTPGAPAKFQSAGGLANISLTTEFVCFIVPAVTALFITHAVKMLQMTLEPTAWPNLDKYAKKAMGLASILELIGIHALGYMMLSDGIYWVRLLYICFIFGIEVSLFAPILIKSFYKKTK